MNEALQWQERVPALAENRIRYMALLIVLTIGLLALVAQPYDAVAPSNNFFTTNKTVETTDSTLNREDDNQYSGASDNQYSGASDNQTAGASDLHNSDNDGVYSPATRENKNYRSRFDPSTLSYDAIDANTDSSNVGGTTPDGVGGLVTSNRFPDNGDTFSDTGSNASVLTFDKLLASTGLQAAFPSADDDSANVNINLPQSLAALIKVIGDYENDGHVKVLQKIAALDTYSKTARAMAINSLSKFGKNSGTSELLTNIVSDSNEAFALREISINTLVDIDGLKFEQFFVASCQKLATPEFHDRRLFELLILAAYRDVSIYSNRSMTKVIEEIESLSNESKSIEALCSIKMRFRGYKATRSELKKYESSSDPLVLSSLVYYLSKNASRDQLAREMLIRTAQESVNPMVRIMANKALNRNALD